jgi:hypothetical protein
MVKGGREEEHILGNQRLNIGRVGRGGTTTELLPLSKVMRASSRSRCKRCITLTRGRRRDSNINASISEGGRGGVALVVGVTEEANVGRAGAGGGRNEVPGFGGDRVAGSNKTSKGGKFMADGAKGVKDGIARGGFVVAAGKKMIAKEVKGATAKATGGSRRKGRENG